MYADGRAELSPGLVKRRSPSPQWRAKVTSLGAGTEKPFTATVTRAGPGAPLVLEVSGLTCSEIVLEGEISFELQATLD